MSAGLQAVRLPLADPRWTDLVDTHPDATIFHHPAWADLLRATYDYRAFALGVTNSTGQLVAGVPMARVPRPLSGRRWVAFPFSDTCPVLAHDDAARAVVADYLTRAVATG